MERILAGLESLTGEQQFKVLGKLQPSWLSQHSCHKWTVTLNMCEILRILILKTPSGDNDRNDPNTPRNTSDVCRSTNSTH